MNLEKRNKIDNRILAGDGLYADDKNFFKECSAGFWARSQPNINYIATVGHCYSPGFEPIDFGLIYIKKKTIQPVPCVRNTDSELYKELIIKDIISVSCSGAHLCLSGLKSHVKCEYVVALNGFTSDGEYFRDNIFVVNLRNIGEDCGGTIFSYKSLTQVSLNGILTGDLADFDDNINGITGVITKSSILNVFKDLEIVTVP
ncbi:hypothetical protein F8M41_008458 [Gigaspora margarita]|uniref:Serine protease n=1 Tax=Gigaspora margarita TaxID=4874 RepID=A0A8H4AVM0_GIGMA|nr:hypothetical protein F8M41_008458 [Gigaspora margarita]